nr:hypothetical protein [Tanacetum cinerariifolium]
DALDSAAGGNFLDKIHRECLSIIESKSKIAAALKDKLDIRMNRFEKSFKEMKNSFITPTAPLKAVTEVCITYGSNHSYNRCPLTRGGNDFSIFHDNIQQFQTAAVGNFIQNRQNVFNQMHPPGFHQPTQQNNNQNHFQGNNLNQNCSTNQGAIFQNRPPQNPNFQAPPQPNTVMQGKFKAYTTANDANMNNLQLTTNHGRAFLSTAHAIINVFEREIIIRQNQQSLTIQCIDIPSVKKIEQINKIEFINAGGIDSESEEIEDFLNDNSIQFGVESSEPINDNFSDFTIISNPLFDEFYGPFIPIHILEEERTRREHADYINRMEMLFTINPRPHNPTNDNTNVESFSSLQILNQESKPRQEEIDVVSKTTDVLPPSNDGLDEEVNVVGDLRIDNVIQNSEHEYSESEDSDLDNPLLPLPPPESLDKEFDFEIDFEKEISVVKNLIVKFECIDARMKFDVENDVFKFIMFSLLSAESEDTIFDPGIFE